MKLNVEARSYNVSGGHPTLSLLGGFLVDGATNFGAGLREITLVFHLPHSGRPLKTLASLLANYRKYRATLPKVIYRRNQASAEIDVASDLEDAARKTSWGRPSRKLFVGGWEQAIAALALLGKRLKPDDDFDLQGFLRRCESTRSLLPANDTQFRALKQRIERGEVARARKLSPWEKVGIQWDEYTPGARELLDDPFFWSSTDEFAPHGNDTGADLLEDYRDWLRRRRGGDPLAFLSRLLAAWGVEATGRKRETEVADEAAVALAFAEIKLRGALTPAVAVEARAAIERQRAKALAATKRPHRKEHLRRLDLLLEKLARLSRPRRRTAAAK